MAPRLRPVPRRQVRISDSFWNARREVNRLATVPYLLDRLNEGGYIRNFQLAQEGATGGYQGPSFMDSEAYKIIEAASRALEEKPDDTLDRRIDTVIRVIAAAQWDDGYLNTFYQVNKPKYRWSNLRDDHELYSAGHLIEAAAAHYEATEKRTLLAVALRLAEHLEKTFGPKGPKHGAYGGHPKIEMALLRLARATRQDRWTSLAKTFLEARGNHYFAREHGVPDGEYNGTYWQDDRPIREHVSINGHCVRALYLMTAAAELAAETGEAALAAMLERVWDSAALRRMFITGGVGSVPESESFGQDYFLPNGHAFQGTCASAALVLWNHRMALLRGEGRFSNVMERTLYNGLLAGISQDGKKFFRANPLRSDGSHHRQAWFGTACCPPSASCILGRLGDFVYMKSDDSLWVNLYIQGGVATRLMGNEVSLFVKTDYPWAGEVQFVVKAPEPVKFSLRLRLPEWSDGRTIRINGQELYRPSIQEGYIVIEKEWHTGDWVEVEFGMSTRRMEAHPEVNNCRGRTALQRGPIVYCVEQADHADPLDTIHAPVGTDFLPEHRPELFGGITVLSGTGYIRHHSPESTKLYRPASPPQPVPVTAIPYYAWDNREPGPMKVWLPS